jgi:hypothetical protein
MPSFAEIAARNERPTGLAKYFAEDRPQKLNS